MRDNGSMPSSSSQMINGFDDSRLGELPVREQQMIARRRTLLGPAYRLFYETPVHVVRGEGVFLYDPEGNAYLDCYNNVPSVGHCHPRVVAAIAEQAARLNTHTRYLDEAILDYSERLLATLPAAISRVMYACTGSEAVDLALRLARFHTGGSGIIVTENAYHGTSTAAAAISPSLGAASPLGEHVLTVPAPDSYRQPGIDAGAKLARDVEAAIAFFRRHGVGFAGFIADGIFSTDGILSDPPGFLKPTLEAVHRAGGVYIADEVQPGFGRTGAAMWGFMRHGIVPDLVVMGKPMGNGMPIAAVAMRPEFSDDFGSKIRYFNTFGANHVCIAAARAVLEIIQQERLMENADEVGAFLREGLLALQGRFSCIGDVRGAGLFVGVEFVRDRGTREPNGKLGLSVVNALRERRVLISAAGREGQVLKIRPPLPFSRDNATMLLSALEDVLVHASGG